jgi:hypothetical protein
VVVPAILKVLKVFLHMWQEAPLEGIEMHFIIWIQKSLILKVGEDCVEEIKHSSINISPQPFNPNTVK